MITLKFILVGEVTRPGGQSYFIRQSNFWDSSTYPDPTKRVLIGAQFIFYGITPDELTNYETEIFTNDGSLADYFMEFHDPDRITLEYRSYRPMILKIYDYALKKFMVFKVQWFRRPHKELSDEFVFVLYFNKSEGSLKD